MTYFKFKKIKYFRFIINILKSSHMSELFLASFYFQF
jgi:hypothetical protein